MARLKLKFIKGDDDFCDVWESDCGAIVVPPNDDVYPLYDVYLDPDPIEECTNYCKVDTPYSRWCLCGTDGPSKQVRALKSARSLLRGHGLKK